MSKEALGKLALIQGAVEGRYTVMETARRLNLSARRIKQLNFFLLPTGNKSQRHYIRPVGNFEEWKKMISINDGQKYQNLPYSLR